MSIFSQIKMSRIALVYIHRYRYEYILRERAGIKIERKEITMLNGKILIYPTFNHCGRIVSLVDC